MAKIVNGLISGKVGPLVYYVVNGRQMVRQKATHSKQSPKQNAHKQVFTSAMRFAAGLRSCLSGSSIKRFDGVVNNELNGRFISSLRSQWDEETHKFSFISKGFEALDGFEFQPKQSVKKYFMGDVDICLSGSYIKVAFDAIRRRRILLFPEKSLRCDIMVCLSTLRLSTELEVISSIEEKMLVITKDHTEFPATELTFYAAPESLCCITMFLRYYIGGKNHWQLISGDKLNPGRICKALYISG